MSQKKFEKLKANCSNIRAQLLDPKYHSAAVEIITARGLTGGSERARIY
jgi:hypothetical protein